ncbi:MAG: flagellar biosynthetic protein FliO [Actinobacteria bacterium]|nr:flagellar biosynthetic protein FliO [Actinomycetota bacterium]
MKRLQHNNLNISVTGKSSKKWLALAVSFILLFTAGAAFLYSGCWKMPEMDSGDNLNNGAAGDGGSLFEGPVLEAGAEGYPGEAFSTSGTNGPGILIKALVSLMVVAILIYLTIRVLKFFYKNRGEIAAGRTQGSGLIEVLESKNIAPNRSIHLISVAGKYMVIGSSEKQVNYISSLSSKQYDQFRDINKDICPEKSNKRSFRDIFQNYFGSSESGT